ncbi:MAG: 2-oxoglutarate dehydrogenase, E2 component, dihydrolipoamide succinyltransferase [Nocardioidaceae bacterium]|nr:2-oxoglutarate dehydrogenase, E2 component, dihydrolipoamide succinyltransferase [Nocardioidaceae bacterium]
MATPVTLPALGESVTEGTVTRWLKQVGDSVEVDEPLLEVSTDKVDTEIPSPVAGTLLEIKVDEDETVEVGAELATVGDDEGVEEADSPEASEGSGGDGGDGAAEAGTQEGSSGAEAEPAQDDDGADADAGDSAAESSEAASSDAGSPDNGADEEDTTSEDAEAKAGDSGGGDSGGESTSVPLPELGESVTEGTVTRWLKQVGDSVEVDEPLLEVSTDKVDTEIPSPVAGTLLEIKVDEDETVEVGAALAVVGDSSGSADSEDAAEPADDDSADDESAQEEPADEPAEEPADEPPAEEPSEPESAEVETPREGAREEEPKRAPSQSTSKPPTGEGGSGSYVTPLVRKLAAQHGVDLAAVDGTGVGGRIRKQDVLAAAEQTKAPESAPESAPAEQAATSAPPVEVSPLRGTTEKLSRLRKVIASRMVESLQTSAQLTTVVEVDLTSIARLRGRTKDQFAAREGVKLSFLPFFAKAAIDALKTYPQLNASIDTDKGEVTFHGNEHLGVAVDTERGLLVPVIKEAGDLSIAGLARKIADLAARTRDNKIGPDELSGGTFTLTNTGSRGALFDTPIINQPQVAILGTGTVVKRAVVIDDPNLGETIAIRQMVYLALTYDHRLVDGADAARFLTTIKQRLEDANFESELGM